MKAGRCSRRRALTVIAAAAGMPFLTSGGAAERTPVFEWRGRALGAQARLLLAHPDKAAVRRVIARCLDEVARLERIFSLHLPDSEIATLNRTGRLARIPLPHRARRGAALGELSGGAFDVTVQPLWQLYAAHFAANPDDVAGPPVHRIEAGDAASITGRWRWTGPGSASCARHGRDAERDCSGIHHRSRGRAAARGRLRQRARAAWRDGGRRARSEGRPWRVGIPDPSPPTG